MDRTGRSEGNGADFFLPVHGQANMLWHAMNIRLVMALAAYLVLAVVATFALEGALRVALWIFFLGLAIRTIVVSKESDMD